MINSILYDKLVLLVMILMCYLWKSIVMYVNSNMVVAWSRCVTYSGVTASCAIKAMLYQLVYLLMLEFFHLDL